MRKIGLYFIYGFLLHGIAWLFLRSDRHKPSVARKQKIPVTIRFEPQTDRFTPSKNPASTAPGVDGVKRSQRQFQNSNPSKSADRNYQSILPTPSELAGHIPILPASNGGISSAQHIWSQGMGEGGKRTLLRHAGTIFAQMDVPLTARSQLDTGQATVRLTFDSDSLAMTMSALQGQPVLRAILFKYISEKDNQDLIRNIFETLALHELTISLHTIAGSNASANDDPFIWRENRLDLYVTKGTNGFSSRNLRWGSDFRSLSLSLPDEKADRAKAIDEEAYRTLKESPAYSHILSNRAL